MLRNSVAAGLIALIAWAPPVAVQSKPATSSEPFFAVPDTPLTVPKSGKIRVAIVLSETFNLMDNIATLHTFAKVQLPPFGDTGKLPFETFTVSETRKPVTSFGGVQVIPNYTFADAPAADVVVVGAQSGNGSAYMDYLRRMSARGSVMIGVCTGVSKLAQAGLLDGKTATTHHSFVDLFQKKFPKVTFLRDKAYVRGGPLLFTAGGESSGIEVALHVIQLYYGRDIAVRTARSMEYRGPAWQS